MGQRRQRIYIFPNRFGFLGFGLFLICVVVAASFQNNLVFVYAFALLAMGLIAILQTARTVRDIELVDIEINPAPTGEKTHAKIKIKNRTDIPKLSLRGALEFKFTEKRQKIKFEFQMDSLPPLSMRELLVQISVPEQRGVFKVHRLELESNYPYGLFTAWIYLKSDSEIIAYPQPRNHQPLIGHSSSQPDQIDHLRPFVDGDSLARVDWKKYAKNNKLVIREFASDDDSVAILDWNLIQSKDFSTKLHQMSAWIEERNTAQKDYEVHLPNERIVVGRGVHQFRKAMRALAVMVNPNSPGSLG